MMEKALRLLLRPSEKLSGYEVAELIGKSKVGWCMHLNK